jgi:hypothetical protein
VGSARNQQPSKDHQLMSPQAIATAIVLGCPVLALVAILALRHRGRFQFSLQTGLLWVVPFVALLTWVATWDGPLVSRQRVVTHKAALLLTLLSAMIFVVMARRSVLQPKMAAVFVLFYALLFGWIAWKRHEQGVASGSRPQSPAGLFPGLPPPQGEPTGSPP